MNTSPNHVRSALGVLVDELLRPARVAPLRWYTRSRRVCKINYTTGRSALRWYMPGASLQVHFGHSDRELRALEPQYVDIKPQAYGLPHNPLYAILDDLNSHNLSPRHRQTLALILTGNSEKQVARVLGISHHTAHVYVKHLHTEFNVESRGELLSRFIPPEIIIAAMAKRPLPVLSAPAELPSISEIEAGKKDALDKRSSHRRSTLI